jgi:hypothetical protein
MLSALSFDLSWNDLIEYMKNPAKIKLPSKRSEANFNNPKFKFLVKEAGYFIKTCRFSFRFFHERDLILMT